MYLSNLPNVFIQFAKCICPIGKMYLSYLQNVFVQFDKCICPPLVEALLVPLNQQNGSKPQNSPKPRCYNRKRTPIYVQHVQLFLDAPESLDLYPCEWVGRSVGRVSNSKHRSPLAYDLEIMSSCHHVNQRQLLRILAILGHFWELLAILAMFGNPLHLLVSFCNIFWHLFATFVIFLQFLAILPIFGNLWQLSSTFYQHFASFGYLCQLLAIFVNFWPQLKAFFGNFWQSTATFGNCCHVTMPQCHQAFCGNALLGAQGGV